MICILLFVLFVLPCTKVAAQSGQIQLDIGSATVTPSDTVAVPIMLQTDESLSGVAFSVIYDTTALKFLSVGQVADPFDVYQTDQNGRVNCVFLNANTSDVLLAGIHVLAQMQFVIKPNAIVGPLELAGVSLSATGGNLEAKQITGEIEAGTIIVTEQYLQPEFSTWRSQDHFALALVLHNTESISAVQMVLKLPHRFASNAVETTARSATWHLFKSVRDDSTLAVVMSDFELSHPIGAGVGSILDIEITTPSDLGPVGNISVDSLLVTDISGKVVHIAPQNLLLRLQPYLASDHLDSLLVDDAPDTTRILLRDTTIAVIDSSVADDVGVDPPDETVEDDVRLPSWASDIHVRRIRIVEVLADPPSGPDGDANGDGVRESRADEFVELLNTGTESVDISGWHLGDDDVPLSSMFQFGLETQLSPGERITVFGGGDPLGIPGLVFVDDGSIGNGFTNSGDCVILLDALGDTVDVVAFGSEGGKDQSLNRVGDQFVLHSEGEGKDLFSPNKPRPVIDLAFPLPRSREVFVDDRSNMVGYALFTDGKDQEIDASETHWISSHENIVSILPNGAFEAKSPGVAEVWFAWRGRESLHAAITVLPVEVDTLARQGHPIVGIVISEIHTNPGSGDAGDTNRDGVRHSYEDEFIEIINESDNAVDLSGMYLGDDSEIDVLFQLPEGVQLEAGGYLTLFGGGNPQQIAGLVFTDDGRIGDGLSNGGDVVRLISRDGNQIVAQVSFGKSVKGVSFQHNENGQLGLHNELPGKGTFSPGHAQSRLLALRIEGENRTVLVGEKLHLKARGIFDDGEAIFLSDEIEWIYENGGVHEEGSVWQSDSSGEFVIWAQFGSVRSDTLVVTVVKPDSLEHNQTPADSVDIRDENLKTERVVEQVRRDLVLREIHPNPESGPRGDTNKNGVNEPFGDEFLEFQNVGSDTLDLSGWWVGDDDVDASKFFKFPSGTLVLPLGFVVLWGMHKNPKKGHFSDDGRIGDGLANSGDSVLLLSPVGGDDTLRWQYDSSHKGISWIQDTDRMWIRHDSPPRVSRLSPGKAATVLDTLIATIENVQIEVGQQTRAKVLGYAQNDYVVDLTSDVTWYVGSEIVEAKGNTLLGISEGKTFVQPFWEGIRGGSLEIVVIAPSVQIPVDSSDKTDKESEYQKNIAPRFLARPDSVAVCKLGYKFVPQPFDADGDTTEIWIVESPDWLRFETGQLQGVPAESDVGRASLILGITDGRDTTLQETQVWVSSLAQIRASLEVQNVYAGLEYAISLALSGQYEMQIDGDWKWQKGVEGLFLTAQRAGRVPLGISVSNKLGVVVEEWTLPVAQLPEFDLVGVVLNAPQNGELQTDPFSGQMLVIQNVGSVSINLSHWWVGEFGKALTRIPEGFELLPGQVMQLLGTATVPLMPGVVAGLGKIGDGLAPGDWVGLLTPNLRDTLVKEQIPNLPNGKVLIQTSGRWSAESVYDNLDAMVVASLNAAPAVGMENADSLPDTLKTSVPLFPRPNPFQEYTEFGFYSLGGWVAVTVYSVLGQPVRQLVYKHLPHGYYSQVWDGTDDAGHSISAGVYLIHFQTTTSGYTHRVTHVK